MRGLSALPLPVLLAAAGLLLVMGRAAARSARPAAGVLASAVCGAGALGAVNLLAPFTGVALPLSWLTAFGAVVLGAPGVAALLVMQVLLA